MPLFQLGLEKDIKLYQGWFLDFGKKSTLAFICYIV